MKLIKPYYKLETEINEQEILKQIEKIGRTCYKSEDKITDTSAEAFVKMLISRGHESVLEHQSFSVRFICDRGVSHELVRHRLASFSQESTRYCNYGKSDDITFIIPCWMDLKEYIIRDKNWLIDTNLPERQWIESMYEAEKSYNYIIDQGWKPEQARSVLPNSLKTEIVMTANLREWRLIFKQRTAKAAHPQMRELMLPLLKEMQEKIPIIFDDIMEG